MIASFWANSDKNGFILVSSTKLAKFIIING